jgi:hypothetical protein
MSIGILVVDFYDDTKHEIMAKVASAAAAVRDVPVTVLKPEDHGRLSDADFGLIVITKQANVLRKFPVNDPGNAWLSSQYFQHTHEKLAFPARFIAAKHIKQACDAYGVPSSPRVDAYASRVDSEELGGNVFSEGSESGWMLRKMASREFMDKQASASEADALINLPDGHFALVVHTGDGSTIRKYAMPDSEHVKTAAEYFDKYAMQLAPEHRHTFAVSVRNRAEELGVQLQSGSMIEKWASQSWNRHVDAHLEQRKSLLPRNPGAREILDKLAAAIADGETTPEDAAKALSTFDEATGLTKYYDRGVTDPYASTMQKTATAWSAEVDGSTITSEDLRKVAASSKLAGYLGQSFASQFAKDPEAIFDSLPAPEKVLIKQIVDGEA